MANNKRDSAYQVTIPVREATWPPPPQNCSLIHTPKQFADIINLKQHWYAKLLV